MLKHLALLVEGWALRTFGNILWDCNGKLDGLHRKNRRASLMFWAWGKSWYAEEKAAGRIPEKKEEEEEKNGRISKEIQSGI